MISLDVTANVHATPWTDLPNPIVAGDLTRIGLIPGATNDDGVALDITLDDGSHVLGQTSWRLFSDAYRALAEVRQWGDPS